MATVKLYLATDKNPANIYIRFLNGRAIDIVSQINVFVNPKTWDKDRQKIRNVIEVPNRDTLNSKFDKLKTFVVDEFNLDFMDGQIIDKQWLDSAVSKFFNRPKQEVKKTIESHNVYYSDFANWWLNNKAKTWKTEKNAYLNTTAIKQYKSFVKIFEKFERKKNVKVRFKTLTSDQINDFVTFLEDDEVYAENTVLRHVSRLTFFCNRAEGLNIDVNKNFQEKIFITKTEEVMEPYHPENEIESIFKYDFSYNETLDDVCDNYIIGLWTGLRVSDFNNNLDISNIDGDFIEIKTEKTDTWVSIPIHPHVRQILNKRMGLLPPKLSDQKFNKYIKDICFVVGIDNEMRGKLFDKETKRDIIGVYPKYKLVSSHICRRSFATNLYGLVPNAVIQEVGGWSTEKMMLKYIKKTKRESAEVIRDTWKKKYETKNNL